MNPDEFDKYSEIRGIYSDVDIAKNGDYFLNVHRAFMKFEDAHTLYRHYTGREVSAFWKAFAAQSRKTT